MSCSNSQCNSCGPNYDSINGLATKTASYARQANTASVNAQNAFINFNALYLGAKNANPSLDNQGETLLIGALYFNTVSNQMRVWTGTTWNAL